jgi:hypothetical protein
MSAWTRVAAMTPNLMELTCMGLSQLAHCEPEEDGIVVTTHCMYPSNGLVRVTVRRGAETIVASDEGGALGEALAAGIEVRNYDRTPGPPRSRTRSSDSG